jgi:putative Mg2+ transporter-C (MgtC) family protein
MDEASREIIELPGGLEVLRVAARLFIAAALAGLIGAERELTGKAAGLRTHMLVAMGAAVFVLVPVELGLSEGDVGRVVQGIAAGIGFIGAGTILKLTDQREVKGLTTAATVWLTAAVGVAAGAGLAWLALLAVALGWIVLRLFGDLERRMTNQKSQ